MRKEAQVSLAVAVAATIAGSWTLLVPWLNRPRPNDGGNEPWMILLPFLLPAMSAAVGALIGHFVLPRDTRTSWWIAAFGALLASGACVAWYFLGMHLLGATLQHGDRIALATNFGVLFLVSLPIFKRMLRKPQRRDRSRSINP